MKINNVDITTILQSTVSSLLDSPTFTKVATSLPTLSFQTLLDMIRALIPTLNPKP